MTERHVVHAGEQAGSAMRAALAALIGIACIAADTHVGLLASHPFGVEILWVACTKVLTGWQGGAVAAAVSLWAATQLGDHFAGLALESAAFLAASVVMLANEFHKQSLIDALRARVREAEQHGKDNAS